MSTVIVSGCGATGPTISACNAFSLPEAVRGILRVAADGSGMSWLEDPDGRRLTVTWPPGFTARMTPEAALYDMAGQRVAADGDVIKLGQTLPASAAGTPQDPYVPTTCDFVYP